MPCADTTAALCVGLAAVLFGLEAVLAVVETEPMVVAARPIRRGDIILAADVQLADMPVSAIGPSWACNIEDVVGKVAQIDIEAADPFPRIWPEMRPWHRPALR